MIKIKNEYGNYSNWVITHEEDKFYNIELQQDRSIISAISKSKVFQKNNELFSDFVKNIKQNFDFAFASFYTIKLG